MSQISKPSNALNTLVHLLKKADDPDDPGLMVEVGDALLKTAAVMAKKVRQTGKACKGDVTLKFSLKAYRTKNNEVALEIEPITTCKQPQLAQERAVQLFAGHEGELSTTAIQEELPMFSKDSAKVVDGDNDNHAENAGKAGRRMKAV